MRLIRYMSGLEFKALVAGETLTNRTDWRHAGKATDSRGFCFFANDDPMAHQIHYLTGVVTLEYAVIFDASGPVNLRTSVGRYRDQDNDPYDRPMSWQDFIDALDHIGQAPPIYLTEYSIESYSRQLLPILEAYAIERSVDGLEFVFTRVPF